MCGSYARARATTTTAAARADPSRAQTGGAAGRRGARARTQSREGPPSLLSAPPLPSVWDARLLPGRRNARVVSDQPSGGPAATQGSRLGADRGRSRRVRAAPAALPRALRNERTHVVCARLSSHVPSFLPHSLPLPLPLSSTPAGSGAPMTRERARRQQRAGRGDARRSRGAAATLAALLPPSPMISRAASRRV